MNIYFTCSITGGRESEADYHEIVAALMADGHEIPHRIWRNQKYAFLFSASKSIVNIITIIS